MAGKANSIPKEEICAVCGYRVEDCVCCPECGHTCLLDSGGLHCPVCGPLEPVPDENEGRKRL